jgi:ATP-dependent RNA helicase DDX42
LLFSATFKKNVERLATEVLEDAVRIVVGNLGEANQDVTQVAMVFAEAEEKWNWLCSQTASFVAQGSLLIFCSQKGSCEDLTQRLKKQGFRGNALPQIHIYVIAASLHGDKDQNERTQTVFAFSHQNLPILVATDVAARGLDVKSIKNVVNYEVARNIESHTHRIGRTGRAGMRIALPVTNN